MTTAGRRTQYGKCDAVPGHPHKSVKRFPPAQAGPPYGLTPPVEALSSELIAVPVRPGRRVCMLCVQLSGLLRLALRTRGFFQHHHLDRLQTYHGQTIGQRVIGFIVRRQISERLSFTDCPAREISKARSSSVSDRRDIKIPAPSPLRHAHAHADAARCGTQDRLSRPNLQTVPAWRPPDRTG